MEFQIETQFVLLKCFACFLVGKLTECQDLYKVMLETKFDYVLDFAEVDKHAVEEATKALRGNAGLYVLLSRIQIYDVCKPHGNSLTKEIDAVRPEEKAEVEDLNGAYTESNRFMEAEEVLIEQRRRNGIPYVILRPADIIGPRDNTYRWIIYQLWAKATAHLPDQPLAIPDFLESENISLVYVKDVSDVIMRILDVSPQIQDEAFNLAWKETFTLEQVLKTLLDALRMPNIPVKKFPDSERMVSYFYPMAAGRPLDVTKAMEMIGWKTTPFEVAVQETVSFYEDVMTTEKYKVDRDDFIKLVGRTMYGDQKNKFYKALENIYNINLHHLMSHDEL